MKFEKVEEYHVPTCPIFTGPVTYTDYFCVGGNLVVRMEGDIEAVR